MSKMLSYTFLAMVVVILMKCSSAQVFSALPRCTMQIFGDPHVETCSGSGLIPCNVLGLQTFLDIFFLDVTGVSTQWPPGTPATVLSEITIDFKSLTPPHVLTARYRATGGPLPATFTYLASSIAANDVVTLTFLGSSVQLNWVYTNIVIIVDFWSPFYQFTMRASQPVIDTGTGILINGCPIPGRRRRGIDDVRRRNDEAEEACLAAGIPPNYPEMNACIYDVTMTNDPEIAGATALAMASKEIVINMD